MRYARSKTLLLMQIYSFSSGDPRIKRKSCGRGTPKNDTGTLTPHQCNASCKGKCFSSFTCRNYLRSHSAHGLEVGKESNLPFGQGCPSLQEKTVSNGYQYKSSDDLEHDEVQCKTEETNTLGTKFKKQARIESDTQHQKAPTMRT